MKGLGILCKCPRVFNSGVPVPTDLSLGDAHIIPIDDIMMRDNGKDMVRTASANLVELAQPKAPPCGSLTVSTLHGDLGRASWTTANQTVWSSMAAVS